MRQPAISSTALTEPGNEARPTKAIADRIAGVPRFLTVARNWADLPKTTNNAPPATAMIPAGGQTTHGKPSPRTHHQYASDQTTDRSHAEQPQIDT